MKQINLKDTAGARGKRAIRLSQYKADLKNIVFKKGLSFDSICKFSPRVNFADGMLEIGTNLTPETALAPVSPPTPQLRVTTRP